MCGLYVKSALRNAAFIKEDPKSSPRVTRLKYGSLIYWDKIKQKLSSNLIKLLSSLHFIHKIVPMSGVISRLRKIRMLVLDVDGILTDCRTYLGDDGEWKRFFSIRDGYGIKMLVDSGYKVGIITGTIAKDIQERRKALHVHYFYEGK